MPTRKPKAPEREIFVIDSRLSGQPVAYCFVNYTTAYSYLEKFYRSARPLRTYVQFYKSLSERRSYVCTREDGHSLRFQLVRKLGEEDVQDLPENLG